MEQWIEINGYDGIYLISNKGNIMSFYNYGGVGHLLKPRKKYNGYLEIGLRKNGIKKYHLVHRLVAKAFIPNPNNYPTVNHKDENKVNNDVSNLEWCSQSYNNTYGTRIKRIVSKLNKSVCKYSMNGELLETYDSVKEASLKNNIKSCGNISSCLNGSHQQAGGFIWERK